MRVTQTQTHLRAETSANMKKQFGLNYPLRPFYEPRGDSMTHIDGQTQRALIAEIMIYSL